MPRHNPTRPAPRPLRTGGTGAAVETDGHDEWVVRPIAAAAATKTYRCPGCDHHIPVGSSHVVTWRKDRSVDDRRHWHRPCWSARDRRR